MQCFRMISTKCVDCTVHCLLCICSAFKELSTGRNRGCLANQWCGSRNSDFIVDISYIVDITVHKALQLPCITSPVQLVPPTSWYPVWQEQEYDPTLLWQLWLQG